MRVRAWPLCLLVTLWVVQQACAQVAPGTPPLRVAVVSSQSSQPYQQAIRALRQGLEAATVRGQPFQLVQLDGPDTPISVDGRIGLYVALGSQACERLTNKPRQVTVLCAMVPMAQFEKIRSRLPPAMALQTAALYLDQPLSRQVRLMRLAWPNVKRLGALLGSQSATQQPALRDAARAAGFELILAKRDKDAPDFRTLFDVLERSEVLWALPDPDVFGVQFSYNILLAAWRKRVPVMAFSPAYVNAGAVLGLFATPALVGQDAAALALSLLRGQLLPDRTYHARLFEVSVNTTVAASFGMTLDAQVLQLQLRALEASP